LPRPRRCRPRAFSAPRRFQPRRPARPGFPRARSSHRWTLSCAALFRAANALGVRPSEPSPLEEPCRLPAAFASLRVRPDRDIRREGAPLVATAFHRVPIESRAARPRKAPQARPQDRELGFPRPFTARLSSTRVAPRVDLDESLEAACPPRELPRASTSTAGVHPRARRHSAVSPASKLYSPRESVHAASARSPKLAPGLTNVHRADALLGFALLKLSPPRPRVRSTARTSGEPAIPGRPRPAPDG
jgi:hypothetical protein